MSFKESLNEDLTNVFFNTEEFADDCKWDTYNIVAIIDDDDLIKKYSSEFETLSRGSHLIFVAESQFVKLPFINEVHIFNGDAYTISEIKTESGMLVIFLDSGRV